MRCPHNPPDFSDWRTGELYSYVTGSGVSEEAASYMGRAELLEAAQDIWEGKHE